MRVTNGGSLYGRILYAPYHGEPLSPPLTKIFDLQIRHRYPKRIPEREHRSLHHKYQMGSVDWLHICTLDKRRSPSDSLLLEHCLLLLELSTVETRRGIY